MSGNTHICEPQLISSLRCEYAVLEGFGYLCTTCHPLPTLTTNSQVLLASALVFGPLALCTDALQRRGAGDELPTQLPPLPEDSFAPFPVAAGEACAGGELPTPRWAHYGSGPPAPRRPGSACQRASSEPKLMASWLLTFVEAGQLETGICQLGPAESTLGLAFRARSRSRLGSVGAGTSVSSWPSFSS